MRRLVGGNGVGAGAALHGTTRPVALALLAGTVVTIGVTAVPDLRFVYEGLELRIALDTAQCLIGALVAYLFFGRFRRRHMTNDLALSYALALSAATNLFFAALPAIAGDARTTAFSTWAPLTARAISAIVIAVAALAPDRPFRSRRSSGWMLLAALTATVAAVGLGFAALSPHLPQGVEVGLSAADSSRPRLEGDPVLLVVQLVIMGCFAAAAMGFARRAVHDASGLTRALAAACILNAFARLNYFLYPSLYTEIVHTGDFLRLGYFLVLLAGATGEINAYWRAEAAAAVSTERQRMARDLHDGLAQELAFIRSHTSSLAAGKSDLRMLDHVASAAERALVESRRVVAALSAPPSLSLREALDEAARVLVSGSGATVTIDVDTVQVDPGVREGLAWVAREAVSNAVRHGRAGSITIVAREVGGQLCLQIVDDGEGFRDGAASTTGGGFGLRSMRERAEALGGVLTVTSEPPHGTTVEVRVPGSRG